MRQNAQRQPLVFMNKQDPHRALFALLWYLLSHIAIKQYKYALILY